LVTRKDLWVTSKLWNTFHRKEHVKMACKKTLEDLGLEYLDLYLIHFPISLKFVPFETRYPPEWVHDPSSSDPRMEEDLVPMQETWTAMEELVSEGLVKNIGICNMNVALIRQILSYAKVKPAVLQVELHPYNTQTNLLRFCKEKGIQVTGFSNLGAPSYVEIGMAKVEESVMGEACVAEIAAKHGKTPA
jgi:diketogulonate reductase-like aldo/keto reductase